VKATNFRILRFLKKDLPINFAILATYTAELIPNLRIWHFDEAVETCSPVAQPNETIKAGLGSVTCALIKRGVCRFKGFKSNKS
jgi:hypothetical protein